ncbi:MAG: hypothetical protein AAF670_03545 [Planctomycetota bacterium]
MHRQLVGTLWLVLVPLIAGCDGCRREASNEVPLTVPRVPFTVAEGKSYPMTRSDAGSGRLRDGAVKPGHWTTASVTLQSNLQDERGVLETDAGVRRSRGVAFVDPNDVDSAEKAAQNQTVTDSTIAVRRPIVLPKGQRRRLETRLLVPAIGVGDSSRITLNGNVIASTSREQVPLRQSEFVAMAPQTVFFVVLTERPERFAPLQSADWVTTRASMLEFSKALPDNYVIVMPPADGVVPVADTMLDWTSTAVVLWDDLPAEALTPEQRIAVADWIRFGGTFIINGPSAAEMLRADALGQCMLIDPDGNSELDADGAKALIDSLSVASDPSINMIHARLVDGTTRVALAGPARENAATVGDGELVYEGRSGRGRIVQSRFDLMSDWFTAWDSYDSFFNGGILRRPSRRIVVDSIGDDIAGTDFAEGSGTDADDESDVEFELTTQIFPGWNKPVVAPEINTRFRLFSRDARLRESEADLLSAASTMSPVAGKPKEGSPVFASFLDATVTPDAVSGLSGWKQTSDWLLRSQSILFSEVGISIPNSSLVIRSLAIYLTILIPINFVVFRSMGRLEWAWLAIIPCSILGAFLITRAAQLDVGFVRSRNEIALLEMHADYPRGHLTRLVQIYNSLASTYDIELESHDAVIDIDNARIQDSRNMGLFAGRTSTLSLGMAAGPILSGVRVGSNSAGGVHCEQMVDVDGSFVWRPSGDGIHSIQNRTSLSLVDAVVVQRGLDGRLSSALLGDLSPGERLPVSLREVGGTLTSGDLPMGLSDLMDRAASASGLEAGETRLVARVDGFIEGMAINPECRQTQAQTVVLVHLELPAFPSSAIDANLPGDFRRRRTDLGESSVDAPLERAESMETANAPEPKTP